MLEHSCHETHLTEVTQLPHDNPSFVAAIFLGNFFDGRDMSGKG